MCGLRQFEVRIIQILGAQPFAFEQGNKSKGL